MRSTFINVALLAMLVWTPVRAQATPEDAALAFGKAIRESDWAGAARLMHPGALRQMRELMAPLIDMAGESELRRKLFGVASAAEASQVPDTVLFASLLRSVVEDDAGMAEAFKTATITPLGHVNLTGDTVLVVTRMTLEVEGVEISQYDVIPFLRDGAVWRGLLKADLTNLAAMLRKMVGQES